MITLKCPGCEENFTSHKWAKRKFCCRECCSDFRLKERINNPKVSFGSMRTYFLKYVEQICSECGIDTIWNNKKLTLQLDHKDGNLKNNSVSNLRWICPNCHTQTETWGAGNISDSGRLRLKTTIGYHESRIKFYQPILHPSVDYQLSHGPVTAE